MLTKFLLAALLALAPGIAGAQTGTFRQKSSMQSQINSQFPDNTVGAITPAIARNVTSDMLFSWQQAPVVNAQTGTSYTLQLGDFGSLITFTNAAPVAFGIAAASTTGYYPFSFYAENLGSGAVTITPAAGAINGAATYTIASNGGVLVVSDGTNWQIVGAAGTVGAGCTVTGVGTGYVSNDGASGCNTSTTLTASGGIDTESGTLDVTGTFKKSGFTMTFPGSAASLAALNVTNQSVTGGATVNPATNGNLGVLSGGTTTLNCGLVPLQYFTNNGAFTLAAPANDGACAFLMTNGASAAAVTYSGFTVGANVGDTYATTNTNKYIISVTRINGTATYFVKALQ